MEPNDPIQGQNVDPLPVLENPSGNAGSDGQGGSGAVAEERPGNPPATNPAEPPAPTRHPRRGAVSVLKEKWNGPQRPYLILGAIGLVVLGGIAADILAPVPSPIAKPVDVGVQVPAMSSVPGGAATPHYNAIVSQANSEGAQAALAHNQSFMPTVGTLRKRMPPPKPTPTVPMGETTPPPLPVSLPRYGAYPGQSAMNAEIKRITEGMKPVAAVSVNITGKLKGMTYPTATNASAGLTAGTVSTAPVILAQPGHIGFAVLDTSIKSTEPGPVMATIETGRFAGGKLLGGFVRHAGRVVIEFNELTMDHQTYSIQAVAITMDTARTALSTYTNYHVLYRYGWLIGAAVLEGLNNALQSANTSTYLSGSGLASVTHSLSNGQIALSAIGNVGSVLAPIMQQRFATPPTVHVKAGTGIGILFMKPVEEKTS